MGERETEQEQDNGCVYCQIQENKRESTGGKQAQKEGNGGEIRSGRHVSEALSGRR
jgi:hypothetical protein